MFYLNYDFWLFVAGVIAFLVTFVRTFSISKSINNFKEVVMKYDTFDSKKKKEFKQEFSEFIKNYIYNPDTKLLEELPTLKNIQAEIQSYLDCALERALEKFLPNVVSEVDDISEDFNNTALDLATMAEAMETAEQYRDMLNIPATATLSDIYSAMDKHAQELKLKLDSFNKPPKPESKPESEEVNDG